MKRAAFVLAVIVIVFAGAQLVRPGRANPAIEPGHTIQARVGTSSELVAVLDRACSDCHSSATRWPWYTQIAPASWLMTYAVTEGRRAVNFSEWAGYPPEQQRQLLLESCKDASDGKMPGAYTVLHPEMKLSARDIETICTAARDVTAHAAGFPQ